MQTRDKLDKPFICATNTSSQRERERERDQTDVLKKKKKESDRSASSVKLSPNPTLSLSHTHSYISLLSYLRDEESQEDADSNLHCRFNFSLGCETDSRQDDVGWVSSDHNSSVQAPEREESLFAVSRQLPTYHKYNCSLISKALDSEVETTTNRFMRRTQREGERERWGVRLRETGVLLVMG